MKQLFLIFIALVIPVFFVTVAVSGVYNRIRSIRRRLSTAFVRVAEDWENRQPMTQGEGSALRTDGSQQEDTPQLHARHRTLAGLLKTARAEPDDTALLNQAVTALNEVIAEPRTFTRDDSGRHSSELDERRKVVQGTRRPLSSVDVFNQLAGEYEAVRCSTIARAMGLQTRFPGVQPICQPGSEAIAGTSPGPNDRPSAANLR